MSNLKVIDVAGVMEAAGGDRDLATSLAQLFLEQTGKELALLKEAVRSMDTEAAGAIAHKCAGSSSTCGLSELALLFKNFEQAVKTGFPANTEQQLHTINEEVRAIQEVFERFFECTFAS